MIEKIILAMAIAFAVAWDIEIKPPQRAVASEFEVHVEMPAEHQPTVFSLL